MIEIRDTRFTDYFQIDIQPYQKAFTERDVETYYKRARLLGNPKTLVDANGEVLAIADIIDYDGSYLAWCMASMLIKKDKRAARDYYGRIKRTLRLYVDKPVYAHVLPTDIQAVRMIEKLGFKLKETLKGFFQGDDYHLYVKVN